MPDCRRDADHVDDKDRYHAKLTGNDVESLVRTMSDRDGVQSRDHSKPEVEHVKKDKEEQDYAGYSLDQIKPVPRIRISEVIRPRFHGDHQPIDGMID